MSTPSSPAPRAGSEPRSPIAWRASTRCCASTSTRPCDGIVADVTKPEDRARILDAVDGEIGVLVNNAGITKDARIVKMTEEQFLAVIRVNLGAAYELTTAAIARFADGASVVSLASRAYLGNFGQFNYSASKGGLVGMTRALALSSRRASA